MKRFGIVFTFVAVMVLFTTAISATYDKDFIVGIERAEDSEYYADFVNSVEDVVYAANVLLENHPMEDGTPRTVTVEDVDLSDMIKIYTPSNEALLQALESDFTEIPDTWDYIWMLPVTADGYTIQTYYKLSNGVDEGHLRVSSDGTPLFTEEELAAIEAKKGHFCITSGTAAPTESFLPDVLSAETVDAGSVTDFCYISSPLLGGHVAWVKTAEGSVFYFTDCDDDTASAVSTASLASDDIDMTQNEFRAMFLEAYTAKSQTSGFNENGERLYGSASAGTAAAEQQTFGSSAVLKSLLIAAVSTAVFAAVWFLRKRKTT